jgi:hypothetical protein
VSLINEALRKARQAASEHDAKQAEDVFRPRKAYPSRRSGGGGWLGTAMIAAAAAVIGASAAWWFFGDSQSTRAETTIAEARLLDTEVPVTTPAPSPATIDQPSAVDAAEESAVEVPTPRPPQLTDRSPELEAAAEPVVTEPTPSETTAVVTASATGEREFVMEAELGDVVLSLGFIVARANNPFAEINGIEVYVGTEIEGFVVEAIEADRVTLRDDEGLLILRVP